MELSKANEMGNGLLTEIDGTTYRKSSFSNSGGQFCVGVAYDGATVSVISTIRGGPAIQFNREEWRAFLAGAKHGEFDID